MEVVNQSNILLATVVMNPWTKWEAELLIKLLSLSRKDSSTYIENWAKSRNCFELDGPIPRLSK